MRGRVIPDQPFIFELQVVLRLPVTAAVLSKHFDTQMPTLPPENKPVLLLLGLFHSQKYLLISEVLNSLSSTLMV